MTDKTSQDPMLELYIFETTQFLQQLEQIAIENEKTNRYDPRVIGDIFRIVHNIKGASAMMMFTEIANLTHCLEDLFYLLREENPTKVDYSYITDIVLDSIDFIKEELSKIKNSCPVDGNPLLIINKLSDLVENLKQSSFVSIPHQSVEENQKYYISKKKQDFDKSNSFKAVVHFEENCGMPDVRAYMLIDSLKDRATDIYHIPEQLIEDSSSADLIKKQGISIFFKTSYSYEDIENFLSQTLYLDKLEISEIKGTKESEQLKSKEVYDSKAQEKDLVLNQDVINVNVSKLDKLMDLVGELVISEAMVTRNPDLNGLLLDNFQKAARQLRKITSEIQDTVMSVRMVPLSIIFPKVNRIVRDMSKKLDKDVMVDIIGEKTEVDKNIIEYISDPLMHIVRNAVDHGIETKEERITAGKNPQASLILDAKSSGGEVLITITDDGRGLNKEKILAKARENGLVGLSEELMSDKEIYSLIFKPGFSTKESVTEFSGRGVGMDVVMQNVLKIGGTVLVDSTEGQGTSVTIKIPLTLAIIDGMTIKVGKSRYTIPITSIRESFRVKAEDVIEDPQGNEMIIIRGQCYPILRLHEFYSVNTDVVDIPRGIVIMVESGGRSTCLFADELLGEQQIVVKALPHYIRKIKEIKGLAGCTLLGDGSTSLVLDVPGLTSYYQV